MEKMRKSPSGGEEQEERFVSIEQIRHLMKYCKTLSPEYKRRLKRVDNCNAFAC